MLIKNILIVDDEPRTRQGLQRTLESWNNGEFKILIAESGEEVLQIAQTQPIHILLSDIRMPEMTGLQLLQNIRDKGLSPVVIVISAYSQFEYAQEALRLGVVNYLDRKSTRLNSSHVKISYAVFCLKKQRTSISI